MAIFKKIALFGAAAAYVYGNEQLEAQDIEGDDLDDDEASEPGMPGGMPEGLDMEKLKEMMAGMGMGDGEGGLDMEKLQEMMAGMGGEQGGMPEGGMPPQPPKPELVMIESAEAMATTVANRKPAEAIFAIEGDEKAQEIAQKLNDAEKTFAAVAYLKSETTKLTIYKGTEEVVEYTGDFEDFETVQKFTTENRIPLFGQIDDTNFEIYIEAAKKGIFWACLDPATQDEQAKKYSPAFVEAAKQQSGEESYPMVWLDGQKFDEHMKQELGCKTFPTLVLQRGDLMGETEEAIASVEKFVRSFDEKPEDLNAESITKFLEDIKSGTHKAEDPLDELDDDEDDEESKSAPSEEEL